MAGVRQTAGRRLGHTEWLQMSQEQVDRFADVTGDHNFIHVDPERASGTPFAGTIAHGFLTLSLLAPVTQQLQVTAPPSASTTDWTRSASPPPCRSAPIGAAVLTSWR
jgi:acyl dehydratase